MRPDIAAMTSKRTWRLRYSLLAMAALLFRTGVVAGATPVPEHLSLSYAERTWSMRDGLPEQVVQAFAQTRDRYVWIGTTGGLLRFDGASFTLYNRENTPAFSDDNIFCLTVSRDNTLWIGSEGGGLVRYRNGIFHSFSNKDGLTNSFVRTIQQDRTGRIWVGTDNGLFQVDGDRVERVDGDERIPLVAVHALFEDKDGGMWVGGSRILRIYGNQVQEFHFSGEASQNRVKSIFQTDGGDLWVGTVSGLHRMQNCCSGEFTRVAEVNVTVRALRQTSDGILWIGTIGHGLYTYHRGRFATISTPQELPSNTILNLFEDAEQNIWVGTQAGMLRLSNTPVKTVSLPDSSDSDAETVYEDRDGSVWIAAVRVFRFSNGKASLYHFPGINGVRVRNVFRDRDGALWIGTEGEGAYRQTARGVVHYSTASGLVNNFVRAFLQARDGSVWIGTDEGVSQWTPKGFKNYQVRDGLCYFSIRSLLEDRTGNIWIGTDRGLSLLHNARFEDHPVVDALKREKVWAMHEDTDGGLWFGTRTGGLYRWRSGKLSHFTTSSGLPSNSIYELVEDPNGMLWISGPTGISEVNRRELDAAANDPAHRIKVTLYGISEGLEAIQMCGGEKPAGLLASNGEVWFPSSRGPMRIRIDQAGPTEIAPAVIDEVTVDGLQMPPSEQLQLRPDTGRVEIHYGVVQLRSQERVLFRYKLEGFDRDWSRATAERVTHYTNLPAGHYKFLVSAFEMNNPEQISETSLDIAQEPHFYETVWFLTLCTLSLAAAAWSVHKFRVGQLRARFQAVLNERTRLAREMHDTLIQGCVSVSALLEAYLSLGPEEADARQNLMNYACTQLRTTVDEAREAVWNLRQRPASVTVIGPSLRSISEQIQREFGIPVKCAIAEESFELPKDTVHEVLMAVREAIYNAVRHGRPRKVEITVSFHSDECELRITDDGIGFEPGFLSSPQVGHYGVVGMQERIQRIGGRCLVNSSPGAGTEVLIYVPRESGKIEPREAETLL